MIWNSERLENSPDLIKDNSDKLVKSQKAPVILIPAKAEIQKNKMLMNSRFRGSDGLGDFLRDHQQ